METFKEKIKKAQTIAKDPRFEVIEQLISDRALRPFSIYVSYFLSRRGVTANQVTTVMAICCFVGGLCYFPRNIYINIAGIVLLSLNYFLDLVDGEVARLRNECSVLGLFIDNASHQICNPIFALCFGMHIYFLDRSNIFILLLTLLLYSVLNWHRGTTSGEKAALFQAGYDKMYQLEKGSGSKKRPARKNIPSRIGHMILGVYPLIVTGIILVMSYFVGTTILFVYFYIYMALAVLAVTSSIVRRILTLSKAKLEPSANQSA